MQNGFNDLGSMEEQEKTGAPTGEDREESWPAAEPRSGDLPAYDSAEEHVPAREEGEEETLQEEESVPDDGEEQELVRAEQALYEKEDTAQDGLLSEEEEAGTDQPEILIDIEAEEEKARLAQRKARIEKERVERRRTLQQYYQDQYYRDRYYREQENSGTAHTLDGLTVYEDESAAPGNASERAYIKGAGKAEYGPESRIVHGRERPQPAGQDKNAGIEEGGDSGPDLAGRRQGGDLPGGRSVHQQSGEPE